MDEIPDGVLVVLKLLGEGKSLANGSGNALVKGVVEALNKAGFPGFFAHGFVAFGGQDTGIGVPEIRMDEGALLTTFHPSAPSNALFLV